MKKHYLATLSLVGILTGCPDSNPEQTFTVTVENHTSAQPLSPLTVVAYKDNFSLYEVGKPASVALERVAEGGDNSALLAIKQGDDRVTYTASGRGPVAPGASQTVEISVRPNHAPYASVATMLVNTNDAFAGHNALPLRFMSTGQSYSYYLNTYDAGTEENTETAGSIPGPAGGGEGFNASRENDNDAVSIHPGVISADDVLPTSALQSQHRFQNKSIRITVTRTK
ncbi:spondin domain-containing protein [Veronia pacifica]|uniref:Spondin domain-containing protein n=1 Tax=Veronia pacifica TaxID=1080227 RepID=A0A1C3EGA4_9GAMM|nr:spondin domain-containing protein [Veronia pacifica]ODA32244.1 hypothetical protein A8L45_13710 [Veronia pacifica]